MTLIDEADYKRANRKYEAVLERFLEFFRDKESIRLRRATAERLITQIVERARAINEDDRWAYKVGRLVVFGSFVCGAQRPNDVDIAFETVPRWTGERQQVAEQLRRQIRNELSGT